MMRLNWNRWQRKLNRASSSFEASRSVFEDTSVMFGEFCRISGGIVLDVGCGANKAPYLRSAKCDICVGLDPSSGLKPDLDFVHGVGEYLPFRSDVFSQCLSASTLDHCVRPDIVLREMRRVTQTNGRINIWIGLHDRAGHGTLPRQGDSTLHKGWVRLRNREYMYLYRAVSTKVAKKLRKLSVRIRKQSGAVDDPFHLHHFYRNGFLLLLKKTGLEILERRDLPDDLFVTVR